MWIPAIRLLNYFSKDPPTLSYPLAYLHAQFHPHEAGHCAAADMEVVEVEGSEAQLNVSNATVQNTTSKSAPVTWPLNDNQLRCMVQLCSGSNCIEINAYGGVYRQEIIYKPAGECAPRYVRLVYIVCEGSDGSFLSPDADKNGIEHASARISLNAIMLQTFFAENLFAHGLGRQTFELEMPHHAPKVHVLHSKLGLEKARTMSGNELYEFFHDELTKSELYDPLCKFWAFMSCTGYAPPTDPDEFDPKKSSSYVQAHTALGGGRLALFGTGGLHTWASTVAEVPSKFTDETMIDTRKLFDDSCGRGTYWANYSTTLGAAMHELGHCFDLAHTQGGIMGRGFDDMNKFFVSTKRIKDGNKRLAYYNGGSHWFRSSALILRHHKWIDQAPVAKSLDDPCDDLTATIFTDPESRGPFGNNGPMKLKDQTKFNSVDWCLENDAALIGFVAYTGRFIETIQFVATKHADDKRSTMTSHVASVASHTCLTKQPNSRQSKEKDDDDNDEAAATADDGEAHSEDEAESSCPADGLLYSPLYGNSAPGKDLAKHTFFINTDDDEAMIAVDVRAGAWVDALRFHTNYKSSVWLGGQGGTHYRVPMKDGYSFRGLFGTCAGHLGSVGVSLERPRDPDEEEETALEMKENETFHLESPGFIQVVEIQNDNGVVEFFDYSTVSSRSVTISRSSLAKHLPCRLYLIDSQGRISGFNVE